ncbi:hypothetical protein [Moorena sp. SIO4G3]|uniref:hypothetical protein n=1 Tax=Moorena sp. SIO4G3 TaxID=2607821 RepID=UPI001429D59F|nr:hypothetical protein [Moorena sp. SIO4G3]NEO82348.1 hypothetical protein [Moorena sp. SIO4G3]
MSNCRGFPHERLHQDRVIDPDMIIRIVGWAVAKGIGKLGKWIRCTAHQTRRKS